MTPTDSPVALAPRLWLHPPGPRPDALPKDALALPQRAGPAFGDGRHPTTRLCAGAVDFICRQTVGLRVLDVGTGTGVLARIARARGASFVAATEIDPDARQAARANIALDAHRVPIDVADASPDHGGATFDLVVANILEGPLRDLAPALIGALAPGATLLLSGFTRRQVGPMQVAFARPGLVPAQAAYLGEWALLAFRRAPA